MVLNRFLALVGCFIISFLIIQFVYRFLYEELEYTSYHVGTMVTFVFMYSRIFRSKNTLGKKISSWNNEFNPRFDTLFRSSSQPEKFHPTSLVDFMKLLLVTLLVIAPYSVLIYVLGLFEMQNEVMDLLEENLTVFLITAIIFAPIIEEPIFRLHLDLTKKSILWSLGVSVILFFDSWIVVGVFWIYLIWLFVRVSRNNPPSLKLVVYSSAILFGLVHLSNFTSLDYATQFYLIPLLIGEQVIMGLLFSFIRLRYGMKWAMIYHGLYNGFFTVAYLLIFGVE